MNKKLTAGIIAGIAAIIALVIIILEVTGTLKINPTKKSGNTSSTTSVVSEENSDAQNDKSGDNGETASNSDGKNNGESVESNGGNTVTGDKVNDKSGDKSNNSSKTGNKDKKPAKKVVVKDVNAKTSDKTVTVPIYVTKNPGMVAASPVFTFDTKAFEYADCTAGDVFTSCQGNFVDGKIRTVAQVDGIEDTNDNGVLMNIILIPKKGIKAGTYSINIDKSSQYANSAEKLVNPTVAAGKIVIK